MRGSRHKIDLMLIEGDSVTFVEDGTPLQGLCADAGYEVLTCEAGSRVFRYLFEKGDGDAGASAFIQFRGHAIGPNDAGRFHLYWGDNREELLKGVTNWPA